MILLRILGQIFCFHKPIRKLEGTRFFTECRKCGKQSYGIITNLTL